MKPNMYKVYRRADRWTDRQTDRQTPDNKKIYLENLNPPKTPTKTKPRQNKKKTHIDFDLKLLI